MSLHRHTMRVYFLRTFLPGLAILGLIAVTLWPTINNFRQEQMAKYSLTHARIESMALTSPAAGQPVQLQVNKPEFTGRDTEGRPYVVTAAKVLQGLQLDSPMTLDKPQAVLTLNEQSHEAATLQGTTGVYDPQKKTLSLTGNVALIHSDGYTLNMQDLFIDLPNGTSSTKTPVTGVGPTGQISGESMELLDKGNHIILHGKSKVVLTPKAG
jgi:LPS export ABC transporter protein LptC